MSYELRAEVRRRAVPSLSTPGVVPAREIREAVGHEARRLAAVIDQSREEREHLELGVHRVADRIQELRTLEANAHQALREVERDMAAANQVRAFPAGTRASVYPLVEYRRSRRLAIMERSFL